MSEACRNIPEMFMALSLYCKQSYSLWWIEAPLKGNKGSRGHAEMGVQHFLVLFIWKISASKSLFLLNYETKFGNCKAVIKVFSGTVLRNCVRVLVEIKSQIHITIQTKNKLWIHLMCCTEKKSKTKLKIIYILLSFHMVERTQITNLIWNEQVERVMLEKWP